MRRLSNVFLILLWGVLWFPIQIMGSNDSRDSKSPYGVLAFVAWNHDWNNYYEGGDHLEKDAALAEAAGIRWIRMDFLWADVEPDAGRFDFDRYDHIVDTLNRHGIRILGILEYNPTWKKGGWNTVPDTESYVKYARETVRHFKDRVKYWEVWNEPDEATYWTPQDDLTAYSLLLKAAYSAIKNEDPTAQVVLGGLAKDYPFHLRTIYKKAGGGSFDIINIHPFVSPLRPNAIEEVHGIYTAVKKAAAEYGDDHKPIWFTEIGCPGVIRSDHSNGWWQGKSPTESQQADWLRTVYATSRQWPGVEKVFWAFLRETPGYFKNGIDNFGLIRKDFTTKPAYDAYRSITGSESKTTNEGKKRNEP